MVSTAIWVKSSGLHDGKYRSVDLAPYRVKPHLLFCDHRYLLVDFAADLEKSGFALHSIYGFIFSYFIIMATIKFFLSLVCAGLTGGTSKFERSTVSVYSKVIRKRADSGPEKRMSLVRRAQQEIGVRERTGRNDGARVEAYLASVGLHAGDPYCAAFICYLFRLEGYKDPHSGWCPDLFPASRLARSALPGNVIGIYFVNKKRIAHVGLVERMEDSWCVSIEANTNVAGSREGDGVYRKRRHIRTIYKMSDWIAEGRRKT